jgi:hypothetical protein
MGPLTAALVAAIAPIVARVGSRALVIIFTLLRAGALKGIEEAMSVGRDVIAQLATTDLSNEDKRSAAFGRIALLIVAAGGRVVASEINLAIELLVIEFKRGLAP